MAFSFLRNITGGFLLKSASNSSIDGPRIVALFDEPLKQGEEKLLENLLRVSAEVYIFAPEEGNSPGTWAEVAMEAADLCNTNCTLIVSGKFAPAIIRGYGHFNNAGRVVFINPTYDLDIATRMSSFETPCLVITGTPGNLDHDPDAVKYHDLISGSRIQYVRGVTGNPLFMKFTQSFNSIQRFLSDE